MQLSGNYSITYSKQKKPIHSEKKNTSTYFIKSLSKKQVVIVHFTLFSDIQ